MKKTFAILGAALLSLLPLSACGGNGDGLTTVKLNEVTHSIFYAPMYLADSLGYFEEEGIKIQLTNGGGADNTMAAVLSNGADIGFCGPEAALYVALGGTSDIPTVFGQLTQRDGSFLVSRKDEAATFTWESLKGKEILAGRQGGVPAMTFEYILREHGLTDADINLNFDVSFNNMTAAFIEGTAEYCTMFEPTASEVQAEGKGFIVAAVGDQSGVVPYTSFIAKRSWLTKHEDTAKGFLRAMLRAVEFAQTNEPETIAPYLVKHFTDTSVQSLATSIRNYQRIDSWATDMAMTEESFERLQDIIQSAGELPERADFSLFVDNSYVKEVYASLKK